MTKKIYKINPHTKVSAETYGVGASQKGYIISIVTFFVLIIMLSMALSMSFLVADRQRRATNTVKSTQSYYAAEGGIEDVLVRLKKIPQMLPASYVLNINGATADINIPNIIGGSRSVTSQGNNNGIIRKIKTVYGIDNNQSISFYYGVEVGEGGLVMSNGSRVMGNVFSAGNISGSGIIDNDAIVSGNGYSIQGVTVKGNALAYSCLSPAKVYGNLTYVIGGSHTCTVSGTTSVQPQEISAQPMPIPQSQIDGWKSDAASKVFSGNKNISGNQSLGPIKITGSLTISNNATLNITGIVYVVGNIIIDNNATVKLDSSYGSMGGVLLADGTITVSNNNVFSGSGQASSYLLILSTDTSDSAISVSNNALGAVFYTSAGGISISNNVSLMEATGYKVIMKNNSTIQYSSGIVNIYFASGPGGGWKVTSWEEY